MHLYETLFYLSLCSFIKMRDVTNNSVHSSSGMVFIKAMSGQYLQVEIDDDQKIYTISSS